MRSIRRAMVTAGLVAVTSLGLLAQPVAAVHGNAVLDCGTAGTFTLRTTPNSAGFEAPRFTAVLLLEGGGSLSVLAASFNGVLVFSPAAVGVANNNVDELTCSFTLANGTQVTITGVCGGG